MGSHLISGPGEQEFAIIVGSTAINTPCPQSCSGSQFLLPPEGERVALVAMEVAPSLVSEDSAPGDGCRGYSLAHLDFLETLPSSPERSLYLLGHPDHSWLP